MSDWGPHYLQPTGGALGPSRSLWPLVKSGGIDTPILRTADSWLVEEGRERVSAAAKWGQATLRAAVISSGAFFSQNIGLSLLVAGIFRKHVRVFF